MPNFIYLVQIKNRAMKKFILLPFLFFFSFAYGQVDVTDLGKKSFSEIQNSFSISACEVTNDEVLVYCVENGSKLTLLFKNGVLDGIISMTSFPTQYSAERKLELEIEREKSSLGIEPFISNGLTTFNTLDSPVFVTYSVDYVNQTYYMIHYIGAK